MNRGNTLFGFFMSVIFVRTYMVSTEGRTRACYKETKIRYCWLIVVGVVCVKKKKVKWGTIERCLLCS